MMAYLPQNNLWEQSGIGAIPRGRGVGAYDHSGDWTWEYYPPPYDFLASADSVAMPAPVLYTPGRSGLSGCHCGGTCGGCSHGMGLFESGLDVTQWGTGEWITAGVGFYLISKLLGDIGRGSKSVKRAVRSRTSKARRKRELQEELSSL